MADPDLYISSMKKFFDEFKKFAAKGNVLDMAVGIMIGTAFNSIVQSLVNDLIMPPLGLLIGGIKFVDFKLVLKDAVADPSGKIINDAVSINYGNFIQVFINFIIIAFALFVAIKIINTMKERAEKKQKQEEKKEEEKPTPHETKEVQLLTEIRNLLKEQAKK